MPPKVIGNTLYYLATPVIKLILKNSRRAYVMIMVGDEVLVTKDWLGNNSWCLTGGGSKKNETLKQAIIRECQEEIGVVIKDTSLIELIGPQRSVNQFDYWVFLVKLDKKPPVNLNKYEISEAQWLKIEDFASHPCSEELISGLKAV